MDLCLKPAQVAFHAAFRLYESSCVFSLPTWNDMPFTLYSAAQMASFEELRVGPMDVLVVSDQGGIPSCTGDSRATFRQFES